LIFYEFYSLHLLNNKHIKMNNSKNKQKKKLHDLKTQFVQHSLKEYQKINEISQQHKKKTN